MVFIIHLSNVPPNIWEEYFEKVNKSNLLHCLSYGSAMQDLYGQKPLYGVIEKDGANIGIFQALEVRKLGGLIHTISLDRGPLWLEGQGTEENFIGFAKAFRSVFPRRIGRRLRFIPEIEHAADMQTALDNADFKRIGEGYQTLWLDLRQSEDALRTALKKNWRGALKKAESAGLEIDRRDDGTHLPWLLKAYSIDKMKKGYDGPSVELINALHKHGADIHISRALQDGKVIAAILVIKHGRAATYQIGWSNTAGRAASAHHLLLWDALQKLRKDGVTDFDLGGINDDQAKGVKQFKTGMGGAVFTGVGFYR